MRQLYAKSFTVSKWENMYGANGVADSTVVA
jgi:hypothetical protein